MKSSVTLIGMPGAGKTAVGKLLAKRFGKTFVDTDRLIEESYQMPLQQILNEKGYLALREIEERQILAIQPINDVIATGGSAVYSDTAMAHLKSRSSVIFLDIDLDTVKQRITNFAQRGIARAPNQSLDMIYSERLELYKKFCDLHIDNSFTTPNDALTQIITEIRLLPYQR